MFNETLGVRRSIRGKTLIETRRDARGHALHGPYRTLEAGDYCVQFGLAPAEKLGRHDGKLVATIDVTADFGHTILASQDVHVADLRGGGGLFPLRFRTEGARHVEFRVGIHGEAAMEIDAHVALSAIDEAEIAAARFPDPHRAPAFLREREGEFRALYEAGFAVAACGDDILLTKDGITFQANSGDDLNLVGEIFVEKVYRFETATPTVVVDIGMNLGLVAMQFARIPAVERVYAFEPFPETYTRAMANLALNPALAAKIVASNSGIGNVDGRIELRVESPDHSGSRSTRDIGEVGVPVTLEMENAAHALSRILDAEPGRDLIVKVDCEGAEFAIFEELRKAGLLERVTAFMVEWHAMFEDKDQRDLITPLREAGFLIFDRSPPSGNGFFYAVRR